MSVSQVVKELRLPGVSSASDVADIFAAVSSVQAEAMEELVSRCERLLLDHSTVNDEASRVLLAKTLVALLPRSLSAIGRVLRIQRDPLMYEVQFSVLCFLADAPSLFPSTAPSILSLVREYLLNVASDEAQAAWMAGHLLGEHWNGPEATDVLIECAVRGARLAGRAAATHGLGEQLERGSLDRVRILKTIRKLARTDKAAGVRAAARLVLKKSRAP